MAERVYFPGLARGWGPSAPARSMQPDGDGPLWRTALNAHVLDGQLQRREGLVTGGDEGSANFTPSVTMTRLEAGASEYWHEQIPRLMVDIDDPLRPCRVVVTNREILIYQNEIWYNITPIYNFGAVSVNNGSTSVTGAGTEWSTRGLCRGNFIQLPDATGEAPNEWYPVLSVDSDTGLTLDRAFQGTNLVADQYNIRRCFDDREENTVSRDDGENFFAQVFNGDLYLGGGFGNGVGDISRDGAVLKIPQICGQSGFAASDVEWIFGGKYEYVSGLDYVDETFSIYGMQVMEDGRVVLAGRVPTTGGTYKSRIRYSSHLSDVVWSTSPAGATDLVSLQGGITALGRIGETLTAHHTDGVISGALTGNAFYPFSWNPSRAEFGAASSASLVNMQGLEVFPAKDFNLRAFNGASSDVFDAGFRKWMEDLALTLNHLSESWATHLEALDEYRLFLPAKTNGTPPVGETNAYYTRGDGTGWPQFFSVAVGAAVQRPVFDMDDDTAPVFGPFLAARRATRFGGSATVVGVPLWDTQSGWNDEPFLTLRRAGEDTFLLSSDMGTSGLGDVTLISDDLDLGAPELVKHVDEVYLSLGLGTHGPKVVAGTTDIDVGVSYDRGAWEEVALTAPTGSLDVLVAHFTQKSGRSFRIRLQSASFMGHSLVSLVARVSIVGAEVAS